MIFKISVNIFDFYGVRRTLFLEEDQFHVLFCSPLRAKVS